MRSTRVAAALAVGLLALVLPQAQAGSPQVLRGTTVITTARSGTADYVLYDDARLRLNPDGTTPDITMTGAGRIIGFSLDLVRPTGGSDSLGALRVRRAGKDVTYTSALGTTYPRPNSCSTYAGVTVPATVDGVYAGCPDGTTPKLVVIHQGHYRLHVLTDGSPIRITLRLGGVTGTSALRLTRTLRSGEQPLSRIDDLQGRYGRWETTATVPADAGALINLDATWSHAPVLAGVTGCTYATTRPSLPSDYAPRCPGGTEAGFFGPLLNPTQASYDPNSLFSVGQADLTKGTSRVGLSVTDDGGASVQAVTLAWIEQG